VAEGARPETFDRSCFARKRAREDPVRHGPSGRFSIALSEARQTIAYPWAKRA
jgi:hypothetical protein